MPTPPDASLIDARGRKYLTARRARADSSPRSAPTRNPPSRPSPELSHSPAAA